MNKKKKNPNEIAPELNLEINQDLTISEKCQVLYLLAAPFVQKPLPFVDVGKSYNQILSEIESPRVVANAFKHYDDMMKYGSHELCDCLLVVATNLLQKFQQQIPYSKLVPLFKLALGKIALFNSAPLFIEHVSLLYPPKENDESSENDNHFISENLDNFGTDIYGNGNENGMEVVKTELMDLTKEIIERDPSIQTNLTLTPLTKFKDISHLRGIISQENPPKILPFTSQYDLYLGLRRITSKKRRKVALKKYTSSNILSTLYLNSSGKALLSKTGDQSIDAKGNFSLIEKNPIHLQLLNIEEKPTSFISTSFLISSTDFMQNPY